MNAPKRNLPASVMARLVNRANQTASDTQTLLGSFCFERFLYRLGDPVSTSAGAVMIDMTSLNVVRLHEW